MTLNKLLGQAARMTRRDWRAGELRLLALALVIAVAAVSSVGFLVDRLRLGLQRDAAQLLGADLVLTSDKPIADALRRRARDAGLMVTETVTFPSMAINAADADQNTLVATKAVQPGYPLRGALRVQDVPDAPDYTLRAVPERGTVWVDPQILSALRLAPGERLRLGDATLSVQRLITLEPDRGTQFINLAPRVLLNLEDLPATGLIQPGSRVTYRLLVAGEQTAVRAFSAWLGENLDRGQSLESLESGRPEMTRTLERAERFLALVALLAAMIAAVAVAAAARRFSLRHLDSCAMMRCLGLAQRDIFRLFALEFVYVGLIACLAGVAAGYAFHFGLLEVLRSLIVAQLPQPSLMPGVQGVVCGLVLLLGFALPPLAQLRHVAPLRVLRKDIGLPNARALSGYAAGVLGFFALLLWTSNDLRLGSMTAGGFAGGVVVFAAVAWLILKALAPLRAMTGQLGLTWRFAVAAVQRRPAATVVQLVALAVGLMALLLLTVTRTDLVSGWRKAAPPDAPNRFLINIQPDQTEIIEQRLRAAGIRDVTLYPMVRGRLIENNGKPIGPENYENERAQRLVDREFNLSYADEAPSHNTIVAGRWFAPDAHELSMEEGIAQTLGITLGDRLTFDIAGLRVEARVSSLRKVQWDSMRANFFVIMPPRLLEDKPRSFITAFHLPATQSSLTAALLRDFPNLTIVDTSAVLRQVQAVLDQVIAAVEFLFLFTLAAGVLVLYSALASSHDERVREAGLLRALGASRRQLSRAQTAEMVCLGALAGLLAASGASAVGWALAKYAFQFDYGLSPWVFIAGIAGGIVCALTGGWFGLRHVLRTPPLATLRDV
ncbi:MAG TPA: FtsX-like permease family protein [Burkholderiaceae bacterium]|nr:FtsX-like permease family protein [Burkholderiaceae bacterium]